MGKNYLDYKTLRDLVRVLLASQDIKTPVREEVVTEVIDIAETGTVTVEKLQEVINKWNSKIG